MKVVIGVDVDPILPQIMSERPSGDIWATLDLLPELLDAAGSSFPRMTWLIRSDQTVFFATDDFASGYLKKRSFWDELAAKGHELGWHVHHLSLRDGMARFDPDPEWFRTAFDALNQHFPVRATRIGWDYGSNILMQRLRKAGIVVDFSALPGNIVWQPAGPDQCVVDWRHCATTPYWPSQRDYQSPGKDEGGLLEIPITQFPRLGSEVARQLIGRTLHGSLNFRGARNKTRLTTQNWPNLPLVTGKVAAFFWHPEDLAGGGLRNLLANIETLRTNYNAEFVTASEAAAFCSTQR